MLNKVWDSLRSSFWFVPILMVIAALFLSVSMISIDRAVQLEGVTVFGALVPKGTQSASTLLSAIATSILTVAGSVFSIAIVAIQLASGQFGPRMLRDFMQNRVNQFTFGACSATFVYAVVVLWAIEDTTELNFTPQISVFVGLLTTVATIGMLVYFVHNIADAVHADNLIARIGADLGSTIERLASADPDEAVIRKRVCEIDEQFESSAVALSAQKSGYLQKIDVGKLIDVAVQNNLVFKLAYRPGQFVVEDSAIAYMRSSEKNASAKELSSSVQVQINRTFSCGNQRKAEYDVEFPIKQLVEIAIRAISPAVNDPFTAIRCIDRLSVHLCQLLRQPSAKRYRFDDSDTLRVILKPVTFESLVNAAFDQIRQYGRTDVAVTIRLLEALETIGRQTYNEKQKQPLLRQAQMIVRGSEDPSNVPEKNDRQDIANQYALTLASLQ